MIQQNKDSKNFPSYMPVLLHANFPHHKKVIGYRQVLLASPYLYIYIYIYKKSKLTN